MYVVDDILHVEPELEDDGDFSAAGFVELRP